MRRWFSRLLLAALLVGAIDVALPACTSLTKPSCSSCGSGSVGWDSRAKRCRDHDNGRFVKSCCCGH